MTPQSAGHVADYLRTADRERYFASLVVKPAARSAVQALYAFGADVATIRDRAREPTAGEIRLQWWADAITGAGHGDVRANPLADALLDTIAAYDLPTGPLQRLINARRFDLYDDPMPDLHSFEGYAGETVSVLYQFAAMILNGGAEVETGDAAGHLGVAHALIGHLRSFGLNASRGRLFLPLAVYASAGVGEGEIFSGTVSEGLLAAQAHLIEAAREHLHKSSAATARLPRHLRPAFATIGLLNSQLGGIERQAETPFAPPHELADWRKIAALVIWGMRNG